MKKSYFIVPNYTDIRYLNQKALFQIFDQPTHEVTDVKKVYKICGKRKKQIRIDLANLGYDKTFIYPSLDSLCTDIKNKYQIY